MRHFDKFAHDGDNRNKGMARDRITADLGADVRRIDIRAHAEGRGLEFIANDDGTVDVVTHKLDRRSARGVKPSRYSGVIRVDFHGTVSYDLQANLQRSRGALTMWMRAPQTAATNLPGDTTTSDATVTTSIAAADASAPVQAVVETYEQRAAREHTERQAAAAAVFSRR